MSKTRLIELIRTERSSLEIVVGRLSEAQMVQAGAQGEWSVKDLLAHVTFWEQRLLAWLEVARGEGATPPEPVSTDEEVDRLNAQVFATNHGRPLSEVLAEFGQSGEQVVSAVEACSEADLTEPGRFGWLEGEPLWRQVSMDTFGHYREHQAAIQAWADRMSRA
jgi:hypothetical protein